MDAVVLALITGLTTGGISCFAVQGGLLTSLISGQKDKEKQVITYFLISKFLAYSILGGLLGYLGTQVSISSKTQGLFQILAGIFMILTAGRIADIHPIFRNFTFTPPKFLFKIARNASKRKDLIGSMLLGTATILIPCGVTQAMMLLSVSSESFILGAAILGAFTLGTSPIFFALGMASKLLLTNKKLSYVAATLILYLGLLSINTGQNLRGSVHTFQNYYKAAFSVEKSDGKIAGVNNTGKQEVTINVTTGGYTSDVESLKAGVPVSLKLVSSNVQGCSRAFTIPEYNISEVLPVTGEKIVEFTPTKPGRLTYTCSMGMYTGQFTVVN